MKQVALTIILFLVAVAMAAVFVISPNGLWGDTKAHYDKVHTQTSTIQAPTN